MKHRPHGAHFTNPAGLTAGEATGDSPAALLNPESDRVRFLLEELDDVIFQAIRGDEISLRLAHKLWPRVLAELGLELVEESREQYLRYANDLIQRGDEERMRNPQLACAAVEIVELLTR